MKPLLVLALCLATLLASTPARADDLFDAQIHARRMKKAGAGVAGVGFVHLAAGLALTFAVVGIHEECQGRGYTCAEGAGFLFIPAVSLVAVGGLLSVVGLPTWLVGRARERRLQALTPTPIGQLTPVPPMPQ